MKQIELIVKNVEELLSMSRAEYVEMYMNARRASLIEKDSRRRLVIMNAINMIDVVRRALE